jgi:flagellar biosynthesis protein FlhB
MADEQRSEKPTQRRLDRARKEGNFPTSRELISAVHFTGFAAISTSFTAVFVMRMARLTRELLSRAFRTDVSVEALVALTRSVIVPQFYPLSLGGAALTALVIGVQLATTKMGISLNKLAPDFKRLNFLKRFSSVPAQNVPKLLQALLLLPLVGLAVYYEVTENLAEFLEMPWMGAQVAAAHIGMTLEKLLWRAAGLFLLVGLADLAWQRHRYMKQLRMSKQEIREEHKESEGNPHLKMRVRRLQRDMARRNMMKEIPKATAVIVNPTHYAIAIRYQVNGSGAPRVIAKGKNYLAARIRKKAMEHQIPIVENPPLAQALYKSVDVGQEIPAHLYRAVAEILAYIYRLMGGHLPGA